MILGMILGIVLVLLGLLIILGEARSFRTQKSTNQTKFLQGKLPKNINGFYLGSVTGLDTTWQGKEFDATHSAGINIFGENREKRYPFKTYPARGLQDKNLEVLRIDYSQNKSPWWLKFVVDEIVEVGPNKYLGKIHLDIIPGLPFSVGYFKLEK
jgi:hypothetical protein